MVLPFELFQSALTDVFRSHCVGILAVAAGLAQENGLALAVVGMGEAAGRTFLTGAMRWDRFQPATFPGGLVVELAAELAPALIQDRAVEPGLLPNPAAGLLGGAAGRTGHAGYLEVFDDHQRVAFADGGRRFVQVVGSGVGDLALDALNPSLGLEPIAAVLGLAGHLPLGLGQSVLVAGEGVEWFQHRFPLPIPEGGEAHHAEVDANRERGGVQRHRHFSLRLDRNVPVAGAQADRDVLEGAEHLPAVSVAQPAQLGQENPVVALVELELLGVGEAEAVVQAALLEAGEVGTLLEEILVGPVEVFEGVLQGMHRGNLQPGRQPPGGQQRTVAPGCELLGHRHIADIFAAVFAVSLLQRQRLIEHAAAGSGELSQLALLFAGWLDAELVGLASEHRNTVYLYSIEYRTASRPALSFPAPYGVCRAERSGAPLVPDFGRGVACGQAVDHIPSFGHRVTGLTILGTGEKLEHLAVLLEVAVEPTLGIAVVDARKAVVGPDQRQHLRRLGSFVDGNQVVDDVHDGCLSQSGGYAIARMARSWKRSKNSGASCS